jgi:hypothetical protein
VIEPESFFDRFSLAMAAGRSRREMLRVVAVGLAGALALPGMRGILDAQASDNLYCQVEYPPADLNNCPNKEHNPDNVRTMNGCGPDGTDWPSLQSWGKANFRPLCDQHDICYETCGASKGDCDGALGATLRRSCYQAYAPNSVLGNLCDDVTRIYLEAVLNHGDKAFEKAQKKDCQCCRPLKVFCNCTKKCYDTASACTSDCHASLGCFTGICRFAQAGECN